MLVLHLEGLSKVEIGVRTGKSRQWVHKWIKRYEAGPETDWSQDISRRPNTVYGKTNPETERLVLEARDRLARTKYAQIGAVGIQYELSKPGLLAAVPPTSGAKVNVQKKDYPSQYFCTDEMDLVGPRYLKGSTRLYCFNLIDTSTHAVHIEPIRSKEAVEIVRGIIEAWRQLGLPDCLQMDNEMTFRGSNRHPRSLGLVLRFVLSMGVVVRFIPCAEPWRNGMIEKFNDTFDKRFFRVQKFADFDALKEEADRLGIPYPSNIGEATLRKKVADHTEE